VKAVGNAHHSTSHILAVGPSPAVALRTKPQLCSGLTLWLSGETAGGAAKSNLQWPTKQTGPDRGELSRRQKLQFSAETAADIAFIDAYHSPCDY